MNKLLAALAATLFAAGAYAADKPAEKAADKDKAATTAAAAKPAASAAEKKEAAAEKKAEKADAPKK